MKESGSLPAAAARGAARGDNGRVRLRSSFAFGVTPKLFLAFIAGSVLTGLVVGAGLYAAFNTGFERYVGEREAQRLARLARVAAETYQEFGGWDALRGRDDVWVELNQALRPELRELGPPLPVEGSRRSARARGNGSGDGDTRLPPGAILDAEGLVVVGDVDPRQALERHPVLVGGRNVGWVAAPEHRTLFSDVDLRFREELWNTSWIVLLGALGASALLAASMANLLLAPVKRLAAATRRMVDGDYAVRVAPDSRDELGRLVEDFNRLGHALQRNETLRRDFMADVSHELRTPLAVLRGELEAIEDGLRPATPEALRSLQAEVDRLGKLVDDIHDLSLADAGGVAYHFEPLDPAALAREVMEAAELRLRGQGLSGEVHETGAPLRVRADEHRLRQLLGNLLQNSLRYTQAPGRIRVTVTAAGRGVRLTWEDSPPGVPDDALPRLFERLYRLEGSRSRDAGGSGLGLAICESIARAHGGTVRARHSELGGVAVDVELPLATADGP